MGFVARGVVRRRPDAPDAFEQFVYLCEREPGWGQWDGEFRASVYETAELALAAAASCKGPLFNLPLPNSVRAIPR